MKRTALLICAIMLLVLIPGIVTAQVKPGAGMYFRLCTHGGDDPFWAVVTKGMQDAATELGCKADIDLVGGDVSALQKAFLTAVASKPDGIALVINDDNAYDKPVADAIAKGINVIGINNDDSKGAAGNSRLSYIGQNEVNAGYSIALRMFQVAKAKGINLSTATVALAVEVPGANYGKVRTQGIQKAMDEFGITSKPDIIDAGGLEMTTVEQRITSYLVGHPKLTFIIGLGGICTDRLTASLKNANKKAGEILAGGFDTAPGAIEGMKSGYLEASIDQQQYLQGYMAVYTLYLMKRYSFAPNIDTGGYLVDKKNLATIQTLSAAHIR
ncbi:MAG: substrate-binding domain-containing protein [Rectinemataceae bacterium]